MPVISLNIPPKTAVMALAFGAIALYADSRMIDVSAPEVFSQENDSGEDTAGIKNVTYKRPLMTHLKNVLIADDFASLRALWKLRSALDDVLNADFSATDCDMSPDHLKKIFTPVMPENARRRFVSVTSDLEKAQKTVRNINSARSYASDMPSALKNMEMISRFADLLPDGLSPLMQMKDVISAVTPLMSALGNPAEGKAEKFDMKDDDTDELSADMMPDNDEDDGEVYDVPADDVITENDDEYDSILEIMRMLKNG